MLENIVKLITDYLSENGKEIAIKLLIAVTVFFVILFFIKRLTKKIKARIEKNSVQTDEKYTKKISHLIGNMIFTLLMIFNVLIVFEIIGFDVALLMGGVSLGMGFAMETTIGNMVSGIMILLNKKVKLGDYVQMLGSLKLTGVIDEINIRYTIIKTIDKRRVIVPNMKLATTPIKTLKTEPLIRGEIDLTLPRNINVEQIKKVLTDTINSEEKVVHKDYTNVFISGFDFHGINFKGFFFYDPKGGKGKFVICSELRQKLKIIFKKLGINPPYENITITTE
ncbi:mechanosensitive ion channel [Candidatus Gracilibacteria bacterium]|nr:mechanosensitive ion channel [Candidatus Gracilibacteria bacterium]